MNHLAQGLCSGYQQVNMCISGFRWDIWVLNAYLSQGVVRIGEASIRHDLRQCALKRHSVDLLLLGRLIAAIFIASFGPTFLPSFLFLVLLLVLSSVSLFRRRGSFDRWLNDLLDLVAISRDRV